MNTFERIINEENTRLAAAGRAVVVQIPTPHGILYDHGSGKMLVQYRQSTIDFLGTAGPRGVAIEAKSTEGGALEVRRSKSTKGGGLKRHQRNFLAHYARTGGLAFVYLRHTPSDTRYVLPVAYDGGVGGGDPGKDWAIDPEAPYRCRDGELWLDTVERLGL